ncbi:hypothetical protein ACOSQ2_029857 [Xanthoceras sorbifolium]
MRLFKILFLFNLFVWAYGAPQISSWALIIVFLGCGGAQPKLDASSSLTPPLQMEEPPPPIWSSPLQHGRVMEMKEVN